MFDFFLGLFNALGNIKALAGLLESIYTAAIVMYAKNATKDTLSKIADAAAMQARAENQDDRYKALDAWRAALSRPRQLP